MPDLTLGQAKTIAVVAAVVLIVLAIVAAWIMKEVTQKVVVIVILALLTLVVWSQRSNLQRCADDFVTDPAAGVGDTTATCTFFGREIEVTTSRSS